MSNLSGNTHDKKVPIITPNKIVSLAKSERRLIQHWIIQLVLFSSPSLCPGNENDIEFKAQAVNSWIFAIKR